MSDDLYVYPGTNVLCNRLDIRRADELDRIERRLATQRSREGAPGGAFDLRHLQAIHRHLFQDIYDWAGQIRTVEISKNGSQFQFRRYIEMGMADVHRRLVQRNFLRALDAEQIAMFEMFEREAWSHERCLAHVIERARTAVAPQAAE